MENKFELMVLPGVKKQKITYTFPAGILVTECALSADEIARAIQLRTPLQGDINSRMVVLVNPWMASHIIIEDVL